MQQLDEPNSGAYSRLSPLMRGACLALLLLPTAAMGLFEERLPAPPRRDFSALKSHAVREVVDCRTLVLTIGADERRVRLIGVDEPDDDDDALSAADELRSLLSREFAFVVETERSKESARGDARDSAELSAYVYRAPEGLLVNLELVRRGLVPVSARPSFDQLELFRSYEKHARDAGKGIWAASGDSTAPRAVGRSKSGAGSATSGPSAPNASATVFVTPNGKKYHMQTCSHAAKNGRPMTLADAIRAGLQPCSRCKPPALKKP